MVTPVGLEWATRRKLSISKLRRRGELAPATLELQETFALRRILLKHGQRTENECSFVRKFLAERTTIWREPFWALLSKRDQLKVAQCVKLRMVPSDGEPHDFVAADSASGCMIFVPVKGPAQVQCFDAAGTKLEFKPLETFGFLPVPETLKEGARSEVEKVKANPRSKVYRGEREYGERRGMTTEAGKIRVKIAPDGQYLSISGAEVVPILKKVAEKHGRKHLMKSMGLELPGMGGAGGGGGVGGAGGEGGGRKREGLMRDARYGVGSILVEEGAAPTTVFLIVEGECRIIKGKPRSHTAGSKAISRGARYNLGSSQRSKVGVVLTSGFHTQVDVCHLGSLGPKALIGDIPALLGGVQPASVVAKTPLRVLQCRADKFAAHLDHNARAKIVYVKSAKERKARMQDRGAEVERLIALAGTPLLVDMSGPPTSGNTPSSSKIEAEVVDRFGERRTERGVLKRPPEPGTALATTTTTANTIPDHVVGGQQGVWHGSGAGRTVCSRANRGEEEAAEGPDRSTARRATTASSVSSPHGRIISNSMDARNTPGGSTAAINTSMPASDGNRDRREPSPRGVNLRRVMGTASTPQLPCYSLGSRVTSRGRHGVASFTANVGRLLEPRVTTPGLSGFAAAADGFSAPAGGSIRARPRTGNVLDGNPGGVNDDVSGGWLASGRRGGVAEGGAGTRAAVAAVRGQADALLASHLRPFPTITKNRSLHAVPQPLVVHSRGFADACRGESSRSGMEAWRVARMARYDGLVAPADRLSIVRQIQAGFEVLQGARVSPMA